MADNATSNRITGRMRIRRLVFWSKVMHIVQFSFSTWVLETALGIAGLGICLLFVREAQRGGTLPGCGPRSACEVVSGSRWAKIGAVPVANLGLGLYVFLLVTIIATRIVTFESFAGDLWTIAALAAAASAVWFTFLQLFLIRRLCRFCVILHILGFSLGVIGLENCSFNPTREILIAAAATLGLITLQLMFPGRSHAVWTSSKALRSPQNMQGKKGSNPGDGVSTTVGTVRQEIQLLGKRFQVDANDWPILGSRHAPRKIALMFDVTCTECRSLYRLLEAAVLDSSDGLAVLTIPVPLDPACNPSVTKAKGPHDSCEFTRLFLAVWQCDVAIFEDFRHGLLEPVRCPPLLQLKSKMHRTLGSPLGLALMDAPLERKLQLAIKRHLEMASQRLPQLILEDRLVVGGIASPIELAGIVEFNRRDDR